MNPKSLGYKIIDECKCGFEELFNLIGLIDFNDEREIDRFVKQLVSLHGDSFLECKFGTKPMQTVTENQLKKHIQLRINKGEDLESYPENGKEFSFFATDKALKQLIKKDKPISKKG
jgi:hypothetical protein